MLENPYFRTWEYGRTWEWDYIVTHTEAEGPERLMFREAPRPKEGVPDWEEWDDAKMGEPPKEVTEHFHGPLFKTGEMTYGIALLYASIGDPYAIVEEYWCRMQNAEIIGWAPVKATFGGTVGFQDMWVAREGDNVPDTLYVLTYAAVSREIELATRGSGMMRWEESEAGSSAGIEEYEPDIEAIIDHIKLGEPKTDGRLLPGFIEEKLQRITINAVKRVAQALVALDR